MSSSGSKFTNVLRAKEDLQKSPQQLEQEKREVLKSRIIPLDVEGKSKNDLVQLAKKLHHVLTNLHSQIYDLTERYERQKYDMVELTERARQIEKGKTKTRKSHVVHTGLGGSSFTWLADKFTGTPSKVSLFSRYERVTDRRTFDERRTAFMAPKVSEDKPQLAEKPKAKIKHVEQHLEEPKIERRQSSAPRQPKQETPRDPSPVRVQSDEEEDEETKEMTTSEPESDY